MTEATQERVLLALHNAMYRINFDTVAIGDIVLTDLHFYFILHGGFRYRGEVGQIAAFAVGGPLAAIATALQDGNPSSAREWADGKRNELYGLPPRERAARCAGSLAIAVGDVARFTVENAKSATVGIEMRDGTSHAYAVLPIGEDAARALTSWPSAEPVYDLTRDPDGYAAATSVRPEEFLQRSLLGDASLSPFLANVTGDANYLGMIYDKLVRTAEPERDALLNALLNHPASFREAFGDVLKKRVKSLTGMTLYFGWVPILMAVFVVSGIADGVRERDVWMLLGSLLFAAVGLLLAALTRGLLRERRFAGYARERLLRGRTEG